MSELYYAFIKDNRVEQLLVFASQDEELANRIVEEQEFDSAVWIADNPIALFSTYDGTTFTPPTLDWLYERGFSIENQAMYDARKLAEKEAG